MKILSINPNPMIRAYTFNLFTHSIASNSNNAEELLTQIEFIQKKGESLDIEPAIYNIRYELNNNILKVYSNLYEKELNNKFYRLCNENDEFIIKVDYQKYSRPWGSIFLFVKDLKDLDDSSNYDFRFGKFCRNSLLCESDNEMKTPDYMLKQSFYWLKLKKMKESIKAYISHDGIIWDNMACHNLKNSGDKQRILGIGFELQNDSYYNWLFLNHMQLTANLLAPIHVNYLVTPLKLYSQYSFNPMIDFIPERSEIIKKQYVNITDYIKFNIDNNRYIEFVLDEYYVSERNAYKKYHHNHANLAYGYDNENIYLLGVKDGRPCASIISKNDFILSYESCCENIEKVFIMELAKDEYMFSIEDFIETIENNLNSKITNKKIFNIHSDNNMKSGLDIYDLFTTDEGLNVLLKDIRVPYVFKEHKNYLKECVKFLFSKGYIERYDYTGIFNIVDELHNKSILLLNFTLKCKINSKNAEKLKIIDYLDNMKCMEKSFYLKLIEIVKRAPKEKNDFSS